MTQEALDAVRHACLCNLSLCYTELKMYRLAVEAATRVLKDRPPDELKAKALFRRARAFRLLDEYEYAPAGIL